MCPVIDFKTPLYPFWGLVQQLPRVRALLYEQREVGKDSAPLLSSVPGALNPFFLEVQPPFGSVFHASSEMGQNPSHSSEDIVLE